jgi:hypothetical protein
MIIVTTVVATPDMTTAKPGVLNPSLRLKGSLKKSSAHAVPGHPMITAVAPDEEQGNQRHQPRGDEIQSLALGKEHRVVLDGDGDKREDNHPEDLQHQRGLPKEVVELPRERKQHDQNAHQQHGRDEVKPRLALCRPKNRQLRQTADGRVSKPNPPADNAPYDGEGVPPFLRPLPERLVLVVIEARCGCRRFGALSHRSLGRWSWR